MKVVSDGARLEDLANDSGIIRIKPRVAYVAESEAEVESVIELASVSGEPVTARGGGTSIPSQSVGRGAILLQGRADAVILPDGGVACEPALVKGDLNAKLEGVGRWLPVDPSSYLSCTVGGMVANNSAGIRTPKYGSTIRYVNALRVVIPGLGARSLVPVKVEDALSGERLFRRIAELLDDNRRSIAAEKPRVTKNSSGYRLESVVHDGLLDIPKLIVGSEGTLGVITGVTFSTLEKTGTRLLLIVDAELEELDRAAAAFRAHAPSAVELVDKSVFRRTGKMGRIAKYSRSDAEYMVFCEIEGTEARLRECLDQMASTDAGSLEPLILTDPQDVRDAWAVRNESLTLALAVKEGGRTFVPGVEDLVVPFERLGDLVRLLRGEFERRGLPYISYGHAGDANLHARPLLDPTDRGDRGVLEDIMEACFEAVWRMGGSITGEHGDGMLRARYVARQYPRSFPVMQEVRRAFDPKGLLNPGVKIV